MPKTNDQTRLHFPLQCHFWAKGVLQAIGKKGDRCQCALLNSNVVTTHIHVPVSRGLPRCEPSQQMVLIVNFSESGSCQYQLSFSIFQIWGPLLWSHQQHCQVLGIYVRIQSVTVEIPCRHTPWEFSPTFVSRVLLCLSNSHISLTTPSPLLVSYNRSAFKVLVYPFFSFSPPSNHLAPSPSFK